MLAVFAVGCFFIHPTYLHHIFLLYCLVWAVWWFSTKKNRLMRGVLCFLCFLFWIILDAITFLPPDYYSKENIERRENMKREILDNDSPR